MTAREFLDEHPAAPWAGVVLLIALWCVGAAVAGEPALDAPGLPPARYVIEQPATAGATASRSGFVVVEVAASTGGTPTPAAGDVGPAASTTPLVDGPAAHGSSAGPSTPDPEVP